MDRLAERLRDDAAKIEVPVSAELEARIRASLEAAGPGRVSAKRGRARSRRLWWASTLSGAALAAAILVGLNLWSPASREPAAPAPLPDLATLDLARVPLNVRPAVLTSPLEEEYALLQSDLRKAERAVKEELDNVF